MTEVLPPLGPDNQRLRVSAADYDGRLDLGSDFRRPNSYYEKPGDKEEFPHGIGLEFNRDLTDPETRARAFVVADTIQAFHESLEWVTIDGQRIADPHPLDEDPMWDFMVRRVWRLLDDYMKNWCAP